MQNTNSRMLIRLMVTSMKIKLGLNRAGSKQVWVISPQGVCISTGGNCASGEAKFSSQEIILPFDRGGEEKMG